MTDIRARLWEPDDAELAQRLTDIVARESLKLWELAERLFSGTRGPYRDPHADELDRLVNRNPFAFMFVADPKDGMDRVLLRPEPGPAEVQSRLEDMRHFQRVAPTPEPRARAWIRRRPGWCRSCGDPLSTPDAVGLCQACDEAATAWRPEHLIQEREIAKALSSDRMIL